MTPAEAWEQLGRITIYLANEYPSIKHDIHVESPQRQACELLIAAKDFLYYSEIHRCKRWRPPHKLRGEPTT